MNKKDLEIIAKHSNLKSDELQKILQLYFYPTGANWHHFASIILLSLGVGFLLSGIIFFFAYNWADMSANVKLGLLQGALIISTVSSVLSFFKPIVKNLLLFSSAILVGVILAVYGQIYQTGAQMYHYFFAWSLYILLWSIASKFPPLWLLNIILFNCAGYYYGDFFREQIISLVFLVSINVCFFSILFFISKNYIVVPNWLMNIIMSMISMSNILLCIIALLDDNSNYIFEKNSSWLLLFFPIVIGQYFLGIKERKSYYVGISLSSVIVFIITMIIKVSNNIEVELLLLLAFIIIISTTLLVQYLLKLQKQWHYEK